MATINENTTAVRPRAGVAKMKKNNLRIDMTPMVDLGFLLVAFFVMTTRLSEPTVMALNMPKESQQSSTLAQSAAFTVLIDGEKGVYTYQGTGQEALNKQLTKASNFSPRGGLGDEIRAVQKWLDQPGVFKEGKAGLMLLIKPTENASYAQVIHALDEALINKVGKYAVVKPDQTDKSILAFMQNGQPAANP